MLSTLLEFCLIFIFECFVMKANFGFMLKGIFKRIRIFRLGFGFIAVSDLFIMTFILCFFIMLPLMFGLSCAIIEMSRAFLSIF